MSTEIEIEAGGRVYGADLADTACATKIADALPIEGRANIWGEEIYFSIDVSESGSPDARDEMEVGELAYWPPGSAFCLFFGPTPASHGDEPRAASPVNPVGRILDDVEPLKAVPDGATVLIENG